MASNSIISPKRADNTFQINKQTFLLDQSNPGNFFSTVNSASSSSSSSQSIVQFGNGFFRAPVQSTSSILYTDYTNIAVFYNCIQTVDFVFPVQNKFFYIWVRKRNFDSYSSFKSVLFQLLALGINLNDIQFVQNGPDCLN